MFNKSSVSRNSLISPNRPCNSGETRQSLKPASFKRHASYEESGNRVKQSIQTQSIFPANEIAVSIDSNSDTRTAQRRSPLREVRTIKGND